MAQPASPQQVAPSLTDAQAERAAQRVLAALLRALEGQGNGRAGARALSPGRPGRHPFVESPGVEWLMSLIAPPMLVRPVFTQLRTTINAAAVGTLTITPPNGFWRVPLTDTFGNTTPSVFDLDVEYDNRRTIQALRITPDVTQDGLGLSRYIGPVRTRLIYTFTNQGAVTVPLEILTQALEVRQEVGKELFRMIFYDFADLGIRLDPAQFPDVP